MDAARGCSECEALEVITHTTGNTLAEIPLRVATERGPESQTLTSQIEEPLGAPREKTRPAGGRFGKEKLVLCAAESDRERKEDPSPARTIGIPRYAIRVDIR